MVGGGKDMGQARGSGQGCGRGNGCVCVCVRAGVGGWKKWRLKRVGEGEDGRHDC